MGRRWNDGSFYGEKEKRHYTYINTMLERLFPVAIEQGIKVEPELLEQILKLSQRSGTIVHTITKLVEVLDINQRILDIERLLQAVSPEALAEAARKNPIVGKDTADSWR